LSRNVTRRILTIGLLTLALSALVATPASADTVAHLPGGGWFVLPAPDTTAGGSVAIVTGPDTPPSGVGSLRMHVETDTDRVLVANELGQQTARPWSDLSAAFWTFVEAGSSPEFTPTMRFAGFTSVVNGMPAGFTTMSFEPRIQQTTSVVGGEWQQWTLGPNSRVWGTLGATGQCPQNAPCSFAEWQAAFPTGFWFQVQLGLGTGVAAATGFVDAVTVVDGSTSQSVFTDFGPAVPASPSASPSPSPGPVLPVTGMPDLRWPVLAGVSLILLGLVLALPVRRRRRRGHEVY
jgi:hypothetical protein